MNILCVICHDLLLPTSEDVRFSRCGHIFHFNCLLQWLERSKTCPQCREKVTENKVYKVYFTFPNHETLDNVDSSFLEGKIDSLQFQVLVKDKDIKYHISRNAILEKQTAGLRQEVRKVESEINKKNSVIHVLNEKAEYFKEKYEKYKDLANKLSQKEREMEQMQCMLNTFSKGKLEEVRRLIEKTKDHDTLATYISFMKKEYEERLTTCKHENLSLKNQISELENLVKTISGQSYVRQSKDQMTSDKNSSKVTQKEYAYNQTNTKRKSENQQPISLSSKIKDHVKVNKEDLNIESECPTVVKRLKLHLLSARSCENSHLDLNLQGTGTHSQWVHHIHSRLKCQVSIVCIGVCIMQLWSLWT